jgi:hypothetical protein
MRSTRLLDRVVVGALAVLVYLPGIWWGAPSFADHARSHSWGVDANVPLGPLAELHNIVEPKADRNLGYPLLHPFVVSAAYSPYLAYLWLSGGLGQPSGTYPFGLTNPNLSLRHLLLIAHLVSVVAAAGVVVAVFDAASVLWDRMTAIAAAAFALLVFPMFYYARTGNPDMLVLFCTAVALAAFARILIHGLTVRRAVVLGAAVGAALAAKEPSLASFVGMPVVVAWAEWRRSDGPRFAARFWRATAASLLTAFVVFGVGSGWFVDPERFYAHLEFARNRVTGMATGELEVFHRYPYTIAGHLGLTMAIGRHVADAMTLPGLALAIAGVGWCLRHERRTALAVIPAVSYFVVLFLSARVTYLRYVMPIALPLALFAGRMCTAALNSRRWLIQSGVPALGAAALMIALLRGLDLTYLMVNDSRYAAAAWIHGRARAGDGVEMFGPMHLLPPLTADIRLRQAIEFYSFLGPPRTGPDAVAEIVQGWRERRPSFIIVQPDFTSPPGAERSPSCPVEVYDALKDGSLGYREAAYFETPGLFPWIARPYLDYPTVNPPIRVFVPARDARDES